MPTLCDSDEFQGSFQNFSPSHVLEIIVSAPSSTEMPMPVKPTKKQALTVTCNSGAFQVSETGGATVEKASPSYADAVGDQ